MKQSTGLPTKFVEAFGAKAAAGLIRVIPTASQIGVVAGAASLDDGFPPLTATALASGGVPPSIQDFNGILNQATAWNLWTAAAGIVPYDATFQTAISGYPNGAVVYTATTTVLGRVWVSTVDNNVTNPDAGGAGWVYLTLPSDVLALVSTNAAVAIPASVYLTPGTYTVTVPAGATRCDSQIWGGGGGSGGVGSTGNGSGSGGGSGSYSRKAIFGLVAGQTITLVIGGQGAAGGAGGTGGTGGTTSFGSYHSAPGGGGGSANGVGNGGTGGATPTGGDINIPGAAGTAGATTGTAFGAAGAAAPFGSGGGGAGVGLGGPGPTPGGGGGGSGSSTAQGGALGGPGGAILKWS